MAEVIERQIGDTDCKGSRLPVAHLELILQKEGKLVWLNDPKKGKHLEFFTFRGVF